MRRSLYLILVLATLFATGCATAQKGAMIRAYSSIKDSQYHAALSRLSEAEKLTPPTTALMAEIAFLRGQCYEGLRRLPEAIGSYRYLVATFPESIYAYQAAERLKELTSPLPSMDTSLNPAQVQ